jgi:hypothetical protein
MRRGAQVSVGDARHGRRDNGLVAAEYAAAGDVDPRVGEHLLDVLALDGIAAYLRPSTDLHPVTRSTVLPSRPTDRLFVDRAHIATARDYLSRLAHDAELAESSVAEADVETGSDEVAKGGAESSGTAATDDRGTPDPTAPVDHRMSEPSSDEVDRAWAEIIAGYDTTAPNPPRATPADPRSTTADAQATPADPTRPEAVRPDLQKPETARPDATRPDASRPDATRPDATRPEATRPETRPDRTKPERDRPDRDGPELTPPYRIGPRMTSRPADEPSLLDGLDTFGADLPDDTDDTFTPPVAPPVPRPSLPTALAVIGVVGGLAVFLKPDLLSLLNESLAMFLGFTAIVSGFGTLVWRLRPGDDDEDDPDHGARV